MSGGKETPRQKMIGMMYLFYTALLALNVSAEILTAFTMVDGSLRKTNGITEDVIANTQNEFVKAMVNDSAGVAPFKERADRVIKAAEKAYKQIQHYKLALVGTLEDVYDGDYTTPYTESLDAADQRIENALREKYSEDSNGASMDPNLVDIDDLVSKKDDNNVGGEIFITKGQGKEVRAGREGYKQTLIDIINEGSEKDTVAASVAARKSIIESLNQMLSTEDTKSENDEGEMVPWDVANFEHLPAAGVLTLMTKMQSDVRNTESSVLSYLLSQIGKADMKFNAIKAVVNAKSSYVLVGQPYKAEIFIAAYDSTQNPEILVGGSKIPVNSGVGVFTGNTSSVGPKSFGGVIKLKNKSTGEVKDYPFKGEYEVGQSSLSVSPTKMNVLYIGVPNPIDITASGVPAEKLNVSMSGGGSIQKAGATGSYIAQVKAPGTVNITVTATVDGQSKNLGTKQFRVKRVPDPVAKIAGKREGTIAKAELMAQAGIKAELENFDFDMKFNIVSFRVSSMIRGFAKEANSNSAAFGGQVKQIIQETPSGSKIYFEDIKAKGPDGSIRSLGTIAFKIK
jgi:gliding motility-associated protein GldM